MIGVVTRTSKEEIGKGRVDRPRITFSSLVVLKDTPTIGQTSLI